MFVTSVSIALFMYCNRKDNYDHILKEGSTSQTKDLQEKTNAIAKKMGLKPIPKMVVHPNYEWAAIGINNYPNFGGIITIPPSIFNKKYLDYYLKESRDFTIAHELAHFHYGKDFLWQTKILKIIYFSFFPISMYLLLYNIVAMLVFEIIATAIYPIALIYLIRLNEKKADLMACRYTSDKEKIPYIARLKLFTIDHLEYRNEKGISKWESLKRRIMIDPHGNSRFDWQHPPLTERIEYIQKTLDKKFEKIDPEAVLITSIHEADPYFRIRYGAISTIIGAILYTLTEYLDFRSEKKVDILVKQTKKISSLALITLGFGILAWDAMKKIQNSKFLWGDQKSSPNISVRPLKLLPYPF